MFSLKAPGSFDKTLSYLKTVSKLDVMGLLTSYGKEGVRALSSATPLESGKAAQSWDFEVSRKGDIYTITWTNSDIEDGFPVAIMLQYGYGTGTGGYVQGQDYINPAMKPIFDEISKKVREVISG
jgi:hypothetical protein